MIRRFLDQWRDISISKKLYLVVGIMALLIILELLTLHFAMGNLSAVRAFVGGEGLWSKAQKNAVYQLQRYALTRDEKDYAAFEEALSVPRGDRKARLELGKPQPDMDIVREGFIQGRIHPDDIGPMVNLLRRFYWVRYIASAMQEWQRGDEFLQELQLAGQEYKRLLMDPSADPSLKIRAFERINDLNTELTALEENFSQVLGEGSRWLERIVFVILFFLVLTVECFGLTITFSTSRYISRGLLELNGVAEKIGQGDFGQKLKVKGMDEIGRLTEGVNKMGTLLERSQRDLERRIMERTEELANVARENSHLYEEAKAAVKMRDEFMSIASHELKTPITALYLSLQILERNVLRQEKVDVPKMASLVKNSIQLSRKLATLQQVLMDITKIDAGKFELSKEANELVAVISEAVSQLNVAGHESMISIHADGQIWGDFDSTRIGQVVTNLISNAIKYGEGKPIEVTVAESGGRAKVSVIDRGPGIPSDKTQKIFERFERIGQDHSISGLGLGLFISRQIIEAHGGYLTVSSSLGNGSTFSAEFPL